MTKKKPQAEAAAATKPMVYPTGVIKAVLLSVSKDETRYHLCGVATDGRALVSTDGHRLILVTQARGQMCGDETRILDADSLRLAAGVRGATHVQIDGEVRASRANAVGPSTQLASFPVKEINSKYPPVKQVIPEHTGDDDRRAPLFDPVLLRDACDAMIKAGVKCMRFQTDPKDPLAPARMDGESDDACVTIVLMPRRE